MTAEPHPHPNDEYIITEEELEDYEQWAVRCGYEIQALVHGSNIRSRPYTPAKSEQEPTYQELVDFARWTQTFWKHGIEIMRKNKLVIKSDAPMEKLAFTFYSDLCEIDRKAAYLFQEGYGDKNYKDETVIESRKINSYPKPYEQESREKVLELLDDLRRYADGEYKEADLSDNEHEMRIHLEYENRIWGIMKELRKQGEQR